MKITFKDLIPLCIGAGLSLILGSFVWKVFYFIFTFIGASISFGIVLEKNLNIKDIGEGLQI